MGVWIEFEGYLEFNKAMSPELKKKVNDYINNESWMDPHQPYGTKCPWRIDERDRLVPMAVKYYDHEVWLQYLLREFFRPEGYDVNGLLIYIFEEDKNEKEIFLWESGFFTKQFTVDEKVSYEQVKYAYEVMNKNSMDLMDLNKTLLKLFVTEPDFILSKFSKGK